MHKSRSIDDRKGRRSIVLSVALFVSLCSSIAAADEIPGNWPWKGVTVFASAAAPGDVLLLKKRLGLNSLRLDMNVRVIAQRHALQPDKAWSQSLDWAEAMLDACRRENLAGIIALYQFPIDPALKINQESPEFWNDDARLSETLRLISQLAERFKDRGKELAAYEILSEPLVREGNTVKVPASWMTFQKKLIDTIRQRDTVRYVIINPPPGGSPNAYRDFKPFTGPRLIYGAHMYLPHAYTHQGIHGRELGYTYPGMASWSFWNKKALEQSLAALRQFQLKYDVPVWIGEFSAVRWAPGAESYLKDLVSLFNAYGWGWEYNGYQEYHGWDPDYDALFATDDPDDWKKHCVGEASARWKTLKDIFGRY